MTETPRVTDAVVTEAEGLKLHLSSKNATGYLGVYPARGRFAARLNGRAPDADQHFLGTFDTALEAAVAYAKHVGPPSGPPEVEVTEVDGLQPFEQFGDQIDEDGEKPILICEPRSTSVIKVTLCPLSAGASHPNLILNRCHRLLVLRLRRSATTLTTAMTSGPTPSSFGRSRSNRGACCSMTCP